MEPKLEPRPRLILAPGSIEMMDVRILYGLERLVAAADEILAIGKALQAGTFTEGDDPDEDDLAEE